MTSSVLDRFRARVNQAICEDILCFGLPDNVFISHLRFSDTNKWCWLVYALLDVTQLTTYYSSTRILWPSISYHTDYLTVTGSASNMLNKAISFSLPGFDSSPDDEQDHDNQDNLSDEQVDPAAFNHLPDHMPCFARTLQLVVKDGLKVEDQLTKILRKTSSIVFAVRNSTHGTDFLGGAHRPQTANTHAGTHS
ncbi:hypothetical protein LSH36_1386g00009 [Paralvinella palmiformis]|uniref:Uncharacterized protein n=1 Tax=Paralvinella palmiformis TaxID=53620 RepID=A0AAD9IU17_9ANNE|nr:hypothetical protein LSH36_1386g00009 [Paralvinella palmiformis]